MSKISNKIEEVNNSKEKTLTVFLTSGFPNPDDFVEMSLKLIEAGADIIEIGIPFGDSLADGPVIQSSYTKVLKNNINVSRTFAFIKQIKAKVDTPIIIMTSSNLVLHYGKSKFCEDAKLVGVDGLIVPDVPLEEVNDFFTSDFDLLDKILLTTPTSSSERISKIDNASSGFVYCVSVVGTTGVQNEFDNYVFENIKRTYELVKKNKMQIGFGISSPENVKQFAPYCDGVIVGSAVIKSLGTDDSNYSKTVELIKKLKSACRLK